MDNDVGCICKIPFSDYPNREKSRTWMHGFSGAVVESSCDRVNVNFTGVQDGEPSIQPSIANKLLMEFGRQGHGQAAPKPSHPAPTEELSPREIEILKLIAEGASNRRIAEKLTLAEGTVKNHVSNILNKLHTENRTEAAHLARERKLL